MGRKKAEHATERQAECLTTYRRLFRELGIPPTNVEIGEAMGIDEAAVRRMLACLASHGLVTRVAVGPRGIALTLAGEVFPEAEQESV